MYYTLFYKKLLCEWWNIRIFEDYYTTIKYLKTVSVWEMVE